MLEDDNIWKKIHFVLITSCSSSIKTDFLCSWIFRRAKCHQLLEVQSKMATKILKICMRTALPTTSSSPLDSSWWDFDWILCIQDWEYLDRWPGSYFDGILGVVSGFCTGYNVWTFVSKLTEIIYWKESVFSQISRPTIIFLTFSLSQNRSLWLCLQAYFHLLLVLLPLDLNMVFRPFFLNSSGDGGLQRINQLWYQVSKIVSQLVNQSLNH